MTKSRKPGKDQTQAPSKTSANSNVDADRDEKPDPHLESGSDISSKPGSSGWHLALQAAGERLYLGDPESVATLVRHFVAGVCDRYAAVCTGDSTPWDASRVDGEECQLMAQIFNGNKPGFEPMGAWNTEGGLGHFLAKELEGMIAPEHLTDSETTTAQAFAILVHHVYAILQGTQTEEDVQDAHLGIDALIGEMGRALLGMPTSLFEA